jgi:hypothetical protein
MAPMEALTQERKSNEEAATSFEQNYGPSVRGVIDTIMLMDSFDGGSGSFRVDDLQENTLRIVKTALKNNIGLELPLFSQIADGGQKLTGAYHQPVTERHANFRVEDGLFEGPNGNMSAFLSLPETVQSESGLTETEQDLEDSSHFWPLGKEETARLGIVSLTCAGISAVGGGIVMVGDPHIGLSLIGGSAVIQLSCLAELLPPHRYRTRRS